MDWYPLWNSLRVAALSTVLVFFLGLFAAYYIAKLPHWGKALLDVVLTLPLVLPPTVVGYFLLLAVGPRRPLGIWLTKMAGRGVGFYGCSFSPDVSNGARSAGSF